MRRLAVLVLLVPLLLSPAVAQGPANTATGAAPVVPAAGGAAAAPATGAAAAPAAATTVAPAPGAPLRLPAVTLPLALTPDAAAALAVARSSDIAIAEQGVVSAQGSLQQAEAIKRLKVDAAASYTRSGPSTSITLPGSDQSFSLTPGSIHNESVTATLPLYLGGRDRAAREAAKAGIEAAKQGVNSSVVNIALAARQLVFSALRLEQLAVVAQQRVTAINEHLRITRAMFEAGTAPRFEVVQAETDLAQYQGDVISALTAVSQAKAQLASALNLPQGGEITLEEGPPHALPAGDLHELIAQAVSQRPEMRALQAQITAQEANVRLAQANNRSQLALQGSVANSNAGLSSVGLGWDLTLAWSKALVDGGETRGLVTSARAALQTSRLNLERAEQQVALQVTQAQLQITDAQQALTVAEQGEVNARERARIAEVRFQSGVGLGVEVLDAQTALAAARTQVVNARYELQLAVAALRAALGLTDLKEPS